MKDFFYLFLCVAVLYALSIYHLKILPEDSTDEYEEEYYWEGFD
tara:strand:- start:6169 stop:6300 length:132 start_codon:yes stop_codon:yes gene_type:complete